MKLALFAAALLCASCSDSNNLLMGRVQMDVGTHRIVVTDCYRTSVDAPERLDGGDSYRFAPCRDAVVIIRAGELTVNGRPYGHLAEHDSVLVDHGVVSTSHGSPVN